jgi:ubiquinone/menaquinone biosynthesis C-methylase UbiE
VKRISTPEYLGANGGFTAAEVDASLADLRMFNRWFGGTRVMRRTMQRVARQAGCRKLRWLDVAGASGDVARSLAQSFGKDGIELQTTVLDRALEHLRANRETPPLGQTKANGWGTQAIQGDALALPFADESFDVVGTSLLIHDLEPAEVQKFMREAMRVARVAVVINELRRSRTHLVLAYAGMPLYSRITRHDAIASVKKAYTASEIREMIGGKWPVEIERFYLCRMGVVVWKHKGARQA